MIKILQRWPYGQFSLNHESPQAHGLVAWWPALHRRNVSSIQDLSVYANNATLSGATIIPDKQRGYAIDFIRSSSQYADIGQPGALDFTGVVTVCAWCNVTSFPGAGEYRYILSRGYDGTNEGLYLRLQQSPTNRLVFGSYDGTAYEVFWTRSGWNTGEWRHVAGVFDGATKRLYFDGVEMATGSNQGVLDSNTDWYIGALDLNGTPARFWDGELSDVRVYQTALSATGIAHIYRNPWDLYAPVTPRIWVVGAPAAPGGITIPVLMRSYRQRRV